MFSLPVLGAGGTLGLVGVGGGAIATTGQLTGAAELLFGFSFLMRSTFSGTGKPWTSGAEPNSEYIHVNEEEKAIQKAIYDENGDVIGHVDYKNHGKGAPSGHGHTFPEPGNPASGHGPGNPHIPPGDLPPGWGDLPPGIEPLTPIGR